jgi:hypothetical protein
VDCKQFRAAIEAIQSGQPGAGVCDQFRAHARACPSCAEFVAPYLSKTCSEITEFLSDYFDGELDPAVRQVFDFHVNACRECRCYLDSYAATIRRAKECAAPQAPPPRALIDAILAARRAKP